MKVKKTGDIKAGIHEGRRKPKTSWPGIHEGPRKPNNIKAGNP